MSFSKILILFSTLFLLACGKSSYTRKLKVTKEDQNFALMEYQYCPRGNVQLSLAQNTIEKMWNERLLIAGSLNSDHDNVSLIPLAPPFISFSYSHEILQNNLEQFNQKLNDNLLGPNVFMDELSLLKEMSDRLKFTYCQLEQYWQIPGDSILAYNKIRFRTCVESTCIDEKIKMCQLIKCGANEDLEKLLERFKLEIINPRYQSIQTVKRFSCQKINEQKEIQIRLGAPDDLIKNLILKINRQYFQKNNFAVIFIPTTESNAEINIKWKNDVISHVDMKKLNEVVLSETLKSAPINKIAATLAHELGHILGLPDCYIEYFSNRHKRMNYFELDPTNLMCRAAPENRLSLDNFETIFKHHCQAD